jgi:hypothetical protein
VALVGQPFEAANAAYEVASPSNMRDRTCTTAFGAGFLLAGGAEGRTGTAPGADWLVVGPISKSKSVGPDSNPGEEMVLRESFEVCWFDLFNASLIYFSINYYACLD